MIKNILSELLGTFLLVSIILIVTSDKQYNNYHTSFAIGFALAVAIILTGHISGGHLNPVVSLVMFLNNKIKMGKFIQYVIGQSIGGVLALSFYKIS
jgi:glycerol uptake facilitator-like aquaporin